VSHQHFDFVQGEAFMRSHQHYDYCGMSRKRVGRALFEMGVTDRTLSQKEVATIEKTALKKLRNALQADVQALKGERS